MPSAHVVRAVAALQAAIQRDEGGRGISAMCRPNQLLYATQKMLRKTRPAKAIVLTGFPCLRNNMPPTETDGPPGAVAVARAMLALGFDVTMPIEQHSEGVLQSCVAAACHGERKPEVVSFSTSDRWSEMDQYLLQSISSDVSIVLAIERAGPSMDGQCYTMRGLQMGPTLVAHELNSILSGGFGVETIAIGDGGNELGMGSFYEDVCQTVQNGKTIGCVVSSDFPIAASVSNWGCYALCCACALLAWDQGTVMTGTNKGGKQHTPHEYVWCLVPDEGSIKAVLRAANDAGAVDGISGRAAGSVDGMSLEAQSKMLCELRAIVLETMQLDVEV
eukprot:scaffold129384_cov30-Tisochrysis_lutea.AAC.4